MRSTSLAVESSRTPNTTPWPPSTSTRGQATFAPNFPGDSGKHNPAGPSPSRALSTDSHLSESPTGRLVLPSRGDATYGRPAREQGKMISRHWEEWNGTGPLQGRITPAGALRRKPKTCSGIAVYFRKKKPNHISTGSRYRILADARNATTPKEPQ